MPGAHLRRRPHRSHIPAARRSSANGWSAGCNSRCPSTSIREAGSGSWRKGVGDVLVFDPRTGTTRTGSSALTDLITDSEQGLDGIALDPGFPETPYVYLFATRLVRGRPKDQILRVTAGTSGTREVDVIYASLASPLHQHSGGRLIFGPDGMLYVTVGDASDPGAAQDLASTRGKILRLTSDGEAAPGNPFGSRVWASGIRNSFGLAFDPVSGNLWETENGPECNDELNRIAARGELRLGTGRPIAGPRRRLRTRTRWAEPDPPQRWFTPTIAPTGVAFCDGRALAPTPWTRSSSGPTTPGGSGRRNCRGIGRRSSLRGGGVAGDLLLSLEVGPTAPSTRAPTSGSCGSYQLGGRRGRQGSSQGPDAPGSDRPHTSLRSRTTMAAEEAMVMTLTYEIVSRDLPTIGSPTRTSGSACR